MRSKTYKCKNIRNKAEFIIKIITNRGDEEIK